jgi:hypothetical protein
MKTNKKDFKAYIKKNFPHLTEKDIESAWERFLIKKGSENQTLTEALGISSQRENDLLNEINYLIELHKEHKANLIIHLQNIKRIANKEVTLLEVTPLEKLFMMYWIATEWCETYYKNLYKCEHNPQDIYGKGFREGFDKAALKLWQNIKDLTWKLRHEVNPDLEYNE